MYMHEYICSHVCEYLLRPVADVRCLPRLLSVLYTEAGSLTWTQNSPIQLVQLAQLILRSQLPCCGITGESTHLPRVSMDPGSQILALTFVQQVTLSTAIPRLSISNGKKMHCSNTQILLPSHNYASGYTHSICTTVIINLHYNYWRF